MGGRANRSIGRAASRTAGARTRRRETRGPDGGSARRLRMLVVAAVAAFLLSPTLMVGTADHASACGGGQDDVPIDEDQVIDEYQEHECVEMSVNAALTIAEGGILELRNSTLTIGSDGALVIQENGTLRLDASTYDPEDITIEPGGFLESFLRVNVHLDPDEETDDVEIWAWNAAGNLRQAAELDDQARLRLPLENRTGGQDPIIHTPWHVAANRTLQNGGGVAVNHTSLAASEGPGPVDLDAMALPDENVDTDEPTWPADGADLAADRHVNTTFVALTWQAATDGDADHLAVDHYLVNHTPEDGDPVTRVAGAAVQTFTVGGLQEGNHTFRVQAVDLAGNPSAASDVIEVTVDLVKPNATVVASGLEGHVAGHYRSNVTLLIEADDALSGPDRVEICFEANASCHETADLAALASDGHVIEEDGVHNVTVRVHDLAGNTNATTINVTIDTSPPEAAIDLDPAPPAGHGWYATAPNATVTAQDTGPAGLYEVAYRWDDGTWTPLSAPDVAVSHEGGQELHVRAVDRAGNPSEEVRLAVRVDATPPVAVHHNWTWTPDDDGRVEVDWADERPTDALSGVGRILIERAAATGNATEAVDAGTDATNHTVGPYPTGVNRFRLVIEDRAGNAAATPWVDVTIRSTVAGLQAVGPTSPDRVARGIVPITFTPAGSFAPDVVRFYVDDEPIGVLTQAPYTFEWDSSKHSDGPVTIRAVATDAAGAQQVETLAFDVRNGYRAAMVDHAGPVVLSTFLLGGAVALGAIGVRQWRRWLP